ncbi:MAG: nitroreductase [Spirochaetes bacterium GWF1_51_8]|nr:MAG: nitroreductase [Spirochaetes bacterium GWF1_51_8]
MDVRKAIDTRRAVRSLVPVKIDRKTIDDLAECASLAPSCNNFQPWRFVFVTDPAQLEKVFGSLNKGNEWVRKASMVIGVFSKEEFDCNIKERHYFLFDTGMAAGFILLRATELGLIAHPIAGFDEDKAKEAMGIPPEFRLITLINVGVHTPVIDPILSDNQKLAETQRPPRKDLSEMVFYDRFDSE